jgi:hypothetical protein
MAEFSDYLENIIINHVLRNQAFTPPTTVYVALFTAVTGLESNNPTGEVSGDTYARVAVTLSAASGGATSNSGAVTFPAATASWGHVTHVALVDHETNTNWGTDVNVLMWSEVDTHKDIDAGDTANFAIAALAVIVA